MGKQQSKTQEVIIAQNGAGNSAGAEQMLQHTSVIAYMLITIAVILIIGGAIWLLRYYRKCHGKWIERGVRDFDLRRSMSLFRRQQREANFAASTGTSPV